MQRKLQFSAKKFDNVRFCVRPLCELQLFAALDANDIRHNPHMELWYRHGHLTSLRVSKGRITASKSENHYKSGNVESFSYANREISVLSTPVAGSVTSHTLLLTEQLHNKRSNS